MHPQAATSPSPRNRVQIHVPRIRTAHMPITLYTKGAVVFPTPCIKPSTTMGIP